MSTTLTEPRTALTTWERWLGGYPARNAEETRRFAEYDAAQSRLAGIRREAERRAADRQALLVPMRERI